jgi:hypothetical protein
MALQAKKAVRKQLKIKIALIGPSGAGKTYSALKLAKGFGGKTLLGNTEGDRGYIYADEFEYDIVDIEAPFTPEKFIELIDYAEQNGYNTLIIDSGTHEWSGRGGLLETHDKMPGNSYTNWAKITPRHNAFVDRQLYSKCHIISCLRGKDQYVLEENEKGKQAPKKVGLGADQRANYEYEMMATLMIEQQTHQFTAVKDNTHLFENRYDVLNEKDGINLIKWAESGADVPEMHTQDQLDKLILLAKDNALSGEDMKGLLHWKFSVSSSKELTKAQADELISSLPDAWAQYVAEQSK